MATARTGSPQSGMSLSCLLQYPSLQYLSGGLRLPTPLSGKNPARWPG
ncbi:hypothetical protein [Pectobacterium wasabiae]|nr:hypothetical protein [Pectobacterium wasabiae]